MVERATEIGAHLDIQSAAGHGTTVSVAWPYAEEGN
jgi:signal transduction histidine kinase